MVTLFQIKNTLQIAVPNNHSFALSYSNEKKKNYIYYHK
jgi:hypothetical protein